MKWFDYRKPLAALAAVCLLCGQTGAVGVQTGGAVREPVVIEQWETAELPVQSRDPFLDYLEHLAGVDGEAELLSAGASLTGYNKTLYDRVLEQVKKLAAGGRDDGDPLSTVFEVTLTIPGDDDSVLNQVNGLLVAQALMLDYPCEFFWRDSQVHFKINDFSFLRGAASFSVPFTFEYRASEAYRGADEHHIRAGLGNVASDTVRRAQSIVAANAGKSDYEKLAAYRDAVCSLVEYNQDATAPSAAYGNPWQVVWVFDDNPSTNVVCEGYAKAFKLLCDLSEFQDPRFECVLVTGISRTDVGGGDHMWNHVFLEGKSYLVDVTNSDTGSIGDTEYGGGLFLDVPVPGHNTAGPSSSYVFEMPHGTRISYSLETEMFALYPQTYLTLATESYQASAPSAQVRVTRNGNIAQVTVSGNDTEQFIGSVVWAACYTGDGQMIGANFGSMGSSGTVYLALPMGNAALIRAGVLNPGTMASPLPVSETPVS